MTMKFTHGIATALIAITMFTVPATAQTAEAQTQVEAQANADANASSTLSMVLDRLSDIQQRLDSIEQRLSDVEARMDARGDFQAESPEEGSERAAEARGNNGADVTHEVSVENGTKTIYHRVEKQGRTLVEWTKEIDITGESDVEVEESESEEEEAEAEAETGAEADSRGARAGLGAKVATGQLR